MDIIILMIFAVIPACALVGMLLYSIIISDFEEDEEDGVEK